MERCTGCGACVEVCPHGAIYLVEGKATVDQTLCTACEACIGACPTEAIALTTPEGHPAVEPARVPARRPEPAVIEVRTQPPPVPLRTKVMPVIGASLAWVGSEIVPRLADLALDILDRRAATQRDAGITRLPQSSSRQGGRSGRRQRRRRRAGRG